MPSNYKTTTKPFWVWSDDSEGTNTHFRLNANMDPIEPDDGRNWKLVFVCVVPAAGILGTHDFQPGGIYWTWLAEWTMT